MSLRQSGTIIRALLVALAASPLASAGVAAGTTADDGAPLVGGRGAGTPTGNYLYGVEAIAPDDVLATGVGGEHFAARARRWDGERWLSTHPAGGLGSQMNGVTALSAVDAWGVGGDLHDALVDHWDGASWTSVAPAPRQELEADWLSAVAMSGTDDVWAVGYTFLPDGEQRGEPLIEHWDGTSWTKTPYTLPYGNTLGRLGSVTVISATDAWAVGSTYGHNAPLLLHWDGRDWVPVLPDLRGSGYVGALNSVDAVASDDVWAVGDGSGGTATLHWDGTAWTRVASPTGHHDWLIDDLYGVTAVATDDVWAVGAYGDATWPDHTRTMHWDGTRWHRVHSPDPGVYGNQLSAVSATGPDDVWAVGALTNDGDVDRDLYLHWDGDSWSRVRAR